MLKPVPIAFLFISFLTSCYSDKNRIHPSGHLFTNIDPQQSGINFRNDIKEDSNWNALLYNYGYNGGGVGIGDLDNDGLPDLVLTSNQKGPALYLNKGNFKFDCITQLTGIADSTGWTTGVTMADVNGDGWLDIYICKSGGTEGAVRANKLYINNKNLTFAERGKEFGLADESPTTHAVFFDYDKDGDLDCYTVNHPENFEQILNPYAFTDSATLPTGQDKLFENNNGTFIDITEKAGLAHTYGYGLSASICDVNNDGFEDLFVANDYLSNDQLFINNGNKTFTEKTTFYFANTSLFSMGSDFGDLNNDGRQDLLVVDMKPDNHYRIKNNLISFPNEYYYSYVDRFQPKQFMKNVVQLANQDGSFSEVSQLSGMDKTDWSWSVLIQDFDNDGLNDVHITNGTKRDLHDLDYIMLNDDPSHHRGVMHNDKDFYLQMPTTLLPDYAYKNKGNMNFEDVSEAWGLNSASVSNGAAYGDLDGDGDLDLVVNNTDSLAFVFKNNSVQNNKSSFIRFSLIGAGANKFGVGTNVTIYANGIRQSKSLQISHGFQSCSEPVLHFGLGKNLLVDSVEFLWADGLRSTIKNPGINKTYAVYEDSSASDYSAPINLKQQKPLLTESGKQLKFIHHENSFNDFKRDRMLPYQLSKEGPGLAVGDVNKDGLDDIFATNGKGSPPKLYLQNRDGAFIESQNQPWCFDSTYEGMGAVFFDANGDGVLDLYVATGSNEFAEDDDALIDKLYLNSGAGLFTDASHLLPPIKASNSCVIAGDFDNDGDDDLFVGGRQIPSKFPLPGQSTLLRNDGGKFTDVTDQLAPGLKFAGMVNAALYTDYDSNGSIDLVVCGDWMPVSFFKNTNGAFENITSSTGLNSQSGLWKSLSAADFDSDGDMDYVVGNLGNNSFLKASAKEPLEVLYNDFDKNGVFEPLLFYYLKHKKAPFADRNTFCEQMLKYRNVFLTYNSYATTDWATFFNAAHLPASKKFTCSHLESSWIENLGAGKFKLHALPYQAQVAPIFGTCTFDFNGDGNIDILLQGNWLSNHFSSSPFDAGRGLLLIGDGKGGFLAPPAHQSGFSQPGDAKSLAIISTSDRQPLFASASNSGLLKTFKLSGAINYQRVESSQGEQFAIVEYASGKKQKIELQNCTGYLSQSTRFFWVPNTAKTVSIYKGDKIRRITF